MNTLPNDVARCEGVGFDEDGDWGWREGCETCLRRTAPRNGVHSYIEPPKIIAFWCEFLIEPTDGNKQVPAVAAHATADSLLIATYETKQH
jgi:hypothetical protein